MDPRHCATVEPLVHCAISGWSARGFKVWRIALSSQSFQLTFCQIQGVHVDGWATDAQIERSKNLKGFKLRLLCRRQDDMQPIVIRSDCTACPGR